MTFGEKKRTAGAVLAAAFGAALLAFVPAWAWACEDPPPELEKRGSTVVIPVLFYSPETRWGGGIGGIVTFQMTNPAPHAARGRPSSVSFIATYTQNKQYELSVKPELYLAGDSLIVTGNLSWRKTPSKFFGVGNDVPASGEEAFTPRVFSFEASAAKRIWKIRSVFAGLTYFYDRYALVELDPAGRLTEGTIPGSGGGVMSGAGAVIKWDDRDNTFYPRAGNFIQLSAVACGSLFGSDFTYTKVKADLRTFIPVANTHTLALQAYLLSVFGTAPFTALPMFGTDNTMRGYYGGRFRDNHMAAFQAEYRLPLFWKLSLAGFAGAGRVAPRLSELGFSGFKGVAGWGLRFKVTPEGATLRLDFGYGKGTSGMYFTAGEAF